MVSSSYWYGPLGPGIPGLMGRGCSERVPHRLQPRRRQGKRPLGAASRARLARGVAGRRGGGGGGREGKEGEPARPRAGGGATPPPPGVEFAAQSAGQG